MTDTQRVPAPPDGQSIAWAACGASRARFSSPSKPRRRIMVSHPLSLAGERERSARSWSTRSECGGAANEGGRP